MRDSDSKARKIIDRLAFFCPARAMFAAITISISMAIVVPLVLGAVCFLAGWLIGDGSKR
jgi:1,4-dihydroxy-2-naphthoate octaprenyltransferase